MMPVFRRGKTLIELEDETEHLETEDKRLDAEMSIAQKRVAIAQLRKRGLKPSHFNFEWRRIWSWLKVN